MKKVLIDSDAYFFFIKGNTKIKQELEKANKVYLSVIVIGELLAAFKKGKKEEKNRQLLDRFISKKTVEIIDIGRETTEFYANTKYILEKKGKPIPTNDLWIASQTLENGAVLLTFDKHFLKVAGLRIWPPGED